jgi:toxoflavin synthase
MTISTQKLYDEASEDWIRKEPTLLSDYTARPFLLDWCQPVAGLDVLDLGCGEGYFARNLKIRGAGNIEGVDLSPEMIQRAVAEESREELGIQYRTGDATELDAFPDDCFDLVVSVFLFNYLTREQTAQAMREIHRVLRPGGRFIFAVPHPSFAFSRESSEGQAPFYFTTGDSGYFSGRDQLFEGEIYRRDGVALAVRCVHKTLADYFSSLQSAGFSKLPEIEELHVTPEMLKTDEKFFGPLVDRPLHMAFRMEKS